jgi:hypothetical protein
MALGQHWCCSPGFLCEENTYPDRAGAEWHKLKLTIGGQGLKCWLDGTLACLFG